MRMRPASSRISASTVPGRSRKSARLESPLTVASTASRLHSGQRDSVLLGTPSVIGTLSQLFGSGAGAQDGRGKFPAGNIELMFLRKNHAAFDSDLVKTTGWADIGQNLLDGFNRG